MSVHIKNIINFKYVNKASGVLCMDPQPMNTKQKVLVVIDWVDQTL